jgi:hypothetical protein
MGVLPSFIIPSIYGDYFNGYLSKEWFAEFVGVQPDVVSWPNILWYTAFPLVATIAIIYGMMEELRIFSRALNNELIYIVIAIAWSFMLIRTGALGAIANFMYRGSALIAIVMFTIVFIIGVLMFGLKEVKRRI